jgi:hypothetical protein
LETLLTSKCQNVRDDRSAHTAIPECFSGMHRLQLRVMVIEAFQGSDAHQLAIEPSAEESHSWLTQMLHVQGEGKLQRSNPMGEGQVSFQ